MQLANYIITIIGEIVLPNGLFKGYFPFLSYFIAKQNCLWLLCECEGFKPADLGMKRWETRGSFKTYRRISLCCLLQMSCMSICLDGTQFFSSETVCDTQLIRNHLRTNCVTMALHYIIVPLFQKRQCNAILR